MKTGRRYAGLLAMAALIAFVAFIAGLGATPPAEAVFGDRDGDSVIDVAEEVTGSDPNDHRSLPEDTFPDVILGTLLCGDGIDNDRDGLADQADSGCIDGDDDITSDQSEALLGSNPGSQNSVPEDSRMDAVLEWLGFGFARACNDARDNDADGSIDAADSGCPAPMPQDSDPFEDFTEKLFGSDPTDGNSVPEHEKPNPGSCSDGIDNDRDGMTDAAEQSCQPLANDTIDTATTVGGPLPFEDSVNVNSAGLDSDEPQGDCYFEPHFTIWYEYTAPADGVITADTAGSNFTSALAVFTRNGSRYTQVSCAPAIPNNRFESAGAHATIQVTSGETYYIQAAGYIFPGLPNKLRLVVDTGHPPANDNYASPRVITSLPFSEGLFTADATSEPDEPTGRCISQEPHSSVWYRYDAASDDVLVADTRGSSYDTAIGVWTDSQFGLAEVACASFTPRVAFEVESGRTYFVQVTSRTRGTARSLQFSLTAGQSPANDDFAGATNVTSLPYENTVDTFTATNEPGEPSPTCIFDGDLVNTVWYKTTPQQDGYLKTYAESEEQFFPYLVVGVYEGTSLGDLSGVSCTEPFSENSTAGLAVEAGRTYYFQVGTLSFGFGFATVEPDAGPAGFNTVPTVLTFELESFTVPPCAPSEFTYSDPANDQLGGFGGPPPDDEPDITSVSGGSDGEHFCFTVQYDEPLPEPSDDGNPFARFEIDADQNNDTGFGGFLQFECPGAGDLGLEIGASIEINRSLLVPLGGFFGGDGVAGGEEEQQFGYATFATSSLQFIIPMEALQGDDRFHFLLGSFGPGGLDCVPNAGVIVSPNPPAPGDVNCDGATNSLDSSLILQRFAGLLPFQTLPCEYAGDVNQNGGVGPIDAVLILQYNSGMISEFTPEG